MRHRLGISVIALTMVVVGVMSAPPIQAHDGWAAPLVKWMTTVTPVVPRPVNVVKSRLLPPRLQQSQDNAVSSPEPATIRTDKSNYHPDETVYINGNGFTPGESVRLLVEHTNGANDGQGHLPWWVTADSRMNIATTWHVNPDDSDGASFILTAVGEQSGQTARTTFTDGSNPSGDLDQCANGGVGDPPIPCTTAPPGGAWQNGNLNANQAHYLEGDSVPYRLRLENLATVDDPQTPNPDQIHTVTIEWDTTQGGKHAIDYLTSFDRTETTANPCAGVAGCGVAPPTPAFTTLAIPADPNVTGAGVTPIAGVFTLYDATLLNVSAYTLSGSYAGNSSTRITLTFRADAPNPVLAWGGHIATRLNWPGASAINITGSPYHMRFIDLDGAGGNQDRSLSAGAVIFPATITVIKDTDPNGAQDFSFSTTGGLTPGTFSLDDDGDPTLSNTQVFNGITTFGTKTVLEASALPGYRLQSITCVESGGTENAGTSINSGGAGGTATIPLEEGENVTCTFLNSRQQGTLNVVKRTIPSGDSQVFQFTANYDADGFTLTDGATDSVGLVPGTYSVSETVPTGWDQTSATCDDGSLVSAIGLSAGETVTCTFTNTKRGHIIIDKVTNPSGDPQSFSFDASGGTYADFSLTDAAAPNDQTLVPGTYSVSETVPSGWDQTSATCSDGSPVSAIDLAAGETVTCTFTNTKRAHIIVDKVTLPGGDPQSFSFDAGGGSYADFSLTDAAAPNDQTLVPGTYSVSETVPSGWDQTSATCSDGSPVSAIELAAGETVTCTFTNTKRGHIIVDKVTNPGGDPQSFSFDAGGGSYADFSLTDAAAPNDQTLVPGTYSVSETVPSGWDQTSATCSDGSPINAIALSAGETVTCTFTNTKRGHIIVDKVTYPSGDPQSFSFDAGGGTYGDFSLTDAAAPNDQTLVPGTYSVSETVPSGWDQTSATCSDGSPVSAINLAAGETVTCTFRNTKRGHIIVDKVTYPSGDPQSFSFDAGGGTYADFSLTDAAAPNNQELVPGTYSVSETVPAGWDQTSATCSDGSPVTAVALSAGETVTCTFRNTKRGAIIVDKITYPAGDPQVFTFTPSYGVPFGLADATSPNNSGTLVPGTYSVAETVPGGWDQTGATCSDGSPVSAISVQAGETVTCTFRNTKRGQIIVDKVTNPSGDPTSFEFLTNAGSNFSLTDQQSPHTSGLVVPGTYSVAETVPAGWDLTTAACSDGSLASAISLQAGETVTCTFTNTKRGKVEVKKITNGSIHPELDIKFTLYRTGVPVNEQITGADVALQTLSTLGDADGILQFTDFLVPGTTYTVCENPVPAGWTSLWQIGFQLNGQIVTPYNPNAADNPPQDLGIRCVNFTVNAGQTAQFEVHNDFPGGGQRTIGYWKNWNRCTGGGQAANADRNGGKAAGFFILEDVLPQLIGDFNVTTCAQGVNILGKMDQSGKNMSSDAAYALAAQFLAAKANLTVGAQTCPAVQQAVLDAQTLLDAINFTGSGNYLPSNVKGNLLTTRNNALTYAATLDQYNNGKLCP